MKSVKRSEPAFFHDPSTHEIVETLANCDSLTVFAGAGISRDRGSPVWEDLVSRLLHAQLLQDPAAAKLIKKSERALEAAQVYAAAASPVGAASAVRELYTQLQPGLSERALMEVIAQDMHKVLYSGGRWAPGGALAEAVVRIAIFWRSLSLDVAILTTNYDSNLEEFAADREAIDIAKSYGIRLRPFVGDTVVKPGVLPVYHLHGYIPSSRKPRGNLAFSESGLAGGSEIIGKTTGGGVDWRSKILEERLTSSTTLFVGTTLRDRTVADSLIKTRDSGFNRYVVLPQQSDQWADLAPDIRAIANLALCSRLRHLQVEAVRPDFFGQVPQLLNEIVHCRIACNARYSGQAHSANRYGGRLDRWWQEWRAKSRAGSTGSVQDRTQQVLAGVRNFAGQELTPRRNELLKVEIWIRRDPKRHRELELWGSSEVASRSEQAAHRSMLEYGSNYAAVRAFCQGFAVRGELSGSSRWNCYFSVPIFLAGAPWHNLPVGVVNLISTAGEQRSCLEALDDPAKWAALFTCLSDAGINLLDPRA